MLATDGKLASDNIQKWLMAQMLVEEGCLGKMRVL
jgi:hypothetical protein